MNYEEFKKYVDETLENIYSKLNEEEKTFISYLVTKFNQKCEENEGLKDKIDLRNKENQLLKDRIEKAIEYMKPRFMNCIDNEKRYFEDYYIQEIYEILKGDKE